MIPQRYERKRNNTCGAGADSESSMSGALSGKKLYGMAPKALIRNAHGRYLLLQRSSDSSHYAGLWELPGGKRETDESFGECLVRETREKTGLSIELERVVGFAEGTGTHYRLAFLILEATPDGSDVRLSNEHQQFAWLTLNDSPSLDLCPSMRRFIESFKGLETNLDKGSRHTK